MAPMAGLRSIWLKNNPSIISRSIQASQVRGICHKDHIDPEVKEGKSQPWPYERKKYTYWHQNVFRVDRCVSRWDENSKIIIVDGLPGAGKGKLARELAEQLGMRHMKGVTCDQIYINRNGFDYRSLNWRLPAGVQMVDLKMFLLNPFHPNLYQLQHFMYRARFAQYHEALQHLFNTGQGVVIERCPQGDFVFAKAMNKMGFLADDAVEYHKWLRRETIWELKRPHLVIWLDISAEESLKRMKERGEGKTMTVEYVERVEEVSKREYLGEISQHAELLVYDWSEGQETDLVVEDLERLDFDQYEKRGERMEDWRHYHHSDFDNWRRHYTNFSWKPWRYFHIDDYDYPSVRATDDELVMLRHVLETYVSFLFFSGFFPRLRGFSCYLV